jgi:hypothetical protein
MQVKKSYYMNLTCEFLAYISRRKIFTEEKRTQAGGECGDLLDSADSREDVLAVRLNTVMILGLRKR